MVTYEDFESAAEMARIRDIKERGRHLAFGYENARYEIANLLKSGKTDCYSRVIWDWSARVSKHPVHTAFRGRVLVTRRRNYTELEVIKEK